MKQNQRGIFLFIGLMIISISQIASHFIKLPDLALGSLTGIGIGVMFLAFIRQKQSPVC